MTDNLKSHEGEIVNIVTDTVKETFKSYFNINCDQLMPAMKASPDGGITCKAEFKDIKSEGAVYVTVEEAILEKIAEMVYPPDAVKTEEAYNACAIEIANIVGMRVRTYLNEHGYDLEMSIPSISSLKEETDDDIYITFTVAEKHLHIDITFKVVELENA